MTARIEKTVFISYRRTNLPWALCIYQNLTMHGYDVFFDYLSIDSGNFEKVIIENIKTRAHFIAILTPSALERCSEPDDWLRREIETAMDEHRNIVPLMLESFDFGSATVKKALTGKLSTLNQYNGLRVPSEYFLEAMDRLRDRYLNAVIGGIALPSLNAEAQEITETQKTAASEAPPVEKVELTAQEWLERAYVFFQAENYEESIRCYTESINLQPYSNAYVSRGIAYRIQGDLDQAISDYSEAMRIKPDNKDSRLDNPSILALRGYAYHLKGELDRAMEDNNEAIRLAPNLAYAYHQRGNVRYDKGDLDGALADFNEAFHLKLDIPEIYYDRSRTLSAKDNQVKALSDIQKAVEMDPDNGTYRMKLMTILKLLGSEDEAKAQENIAREIIQKEDEYSQACFEANYGNKDKALELLKIGLEKGRATKEWAREDPDFENIRDDPRFKELVGE